MITDITDIEGDTPPCHRPQSVTDIPPPLGVCHRPAVTDTCPRCASDRTLAGPYYDRTSMLCLNCGKRWKQPEPDPSETGVLALAQARRHLAQARPREGRGRAQPGR